jgi:Bacterial Ig-like domain (group 3)
MPHFTGVNLSTRIRVTQRETRGRAIRPWSSGNRHNHPGFAVNPPIVGLSVAFTATVVPQYDGTLTGTVTFKNGTTMGRVRLRGGRAIFTEVFKSAGTKSISASYSGNANFTPSSTGLTQTF